MKAPEINSLLTPFGFTELESRLYGELVMHGPATGYRLGKAVGKATANAYQAVNSLVRKGAVVEDDSDPKFYHPVPPAELFAALRGDFAGKASDAEAAFAKIYARTSEQRLYRLVQRISLGPRRYGIDSGAISQKVPAHFPWISDLAIFDIKCSNTVLGQSVAHGGGSG